MTLSPLSFSDLGPAKSRAVVIRHIPMCGVWIALLAAFSAAAVDFSAQTHKPNYLVLLAALYALQGLIAECLGVRVDEESISLPRRLSTILPLVFWRRRLPITELREIVSMPRLIGVERVTLGMNFGPQALAVFPSRAKRLQFFRLIERLRPMVNIYRAR